jgi:SAM-dependent methyltransferase
LADSTYIIRGGLEGRERLRVLARVMAPTTHDLLSRVGIAPTAQCLDIGCGGGDVTVELARLAPSGRAVGVDLDDTKLALARDEAAAAGVHNVEFRVQDVREPPAGGERFDVAYLRFVLTHVTDPAAVLGHVCRRLAPGGTVIVEDIDFAGHFCEPHSDAFWRFVDLFTRTAQARGCDPHIGPRLPGLLRAAGLADVGMHVVQPAGWSDDVKAIAPLTLEAIAGSVLDAGLATADELEDTVDRLYAFAATEGALMSLPRVVQAWGRLP